MNYCEQENEYADHVPELDCEKRNNPCDIRVGAYMLVNDASPDQPAKYFLSLSGAVRWAENDMTISSTIKQKIGQYTE